MLGIWEYIYTGEGEVADVDIKGAIVEIRKAFLWIRPKGQLENIDPWNLKKQYLSELRRFCENINWIRYIQHVKKHSLSFFLLPFSFFLFPSPYTSPLFFRGLLLYSMFFSYCFFLRRIKGGDISERARAREEKMGSK